MKFYIFLQAAIFNQFFGSYEGAPFTLVKTYDDGVSYTCFSYIRVWCLVLTWSLFILIDSCLWLHGDPLFLLCISDNVNHSFFNARNNKYSNFYFFSLRRENILPTSGSAQRGLRTTRGTMARPGCSSGSSITSRDRMRPVSFVLSFLLIETDLT